MKSLKVCPCGYLSNQFWPGSGLVIRCPSPGVPVSLFWLLGEGLFFFILYDVSACGKYAKSLCPPLLSWVPGCGAAWGARGRGRQCHQHHLQYSHATCGMCHQHVTCVTSMSYHILFSSVRGCMLSVHNTHTHTRTHTHTHARTHTHTHTPVSLGACIYGGGGLVSVCVCVCVCVYVRACVRACVCVHLMCLNAHLCVGCVGGSVCAYLGVCVPI